MGQHAIGIPQLTLRAYPDLVVLQGQGFEAEVTVCEVCAARKPIQVISNLILSSQHFDQDEDAPH